MMRILTSAVLLLVATPAAAIDCHSTKGSGGHWSWREIDHARCWYRGRHSISKTALHWPERPAGQSPSAGNGTLVHPEPTATDDPITSQPNYELLSTSYWPDLPMRWSLEGRFDGANARTVVKTIAIEADK